MSLIDSIIGVESGGNPNARNPRSSASGLIGSNAAPLSAVDVGRELGAGALVGKLLFSRSPLAILGSVVTVVVSTIESVLFAGARTHVFKEVLEQLPSFANLNAASAVVLVRGVSRQIAAAVHTIPDLIFGSGPSTSFCRLRHAVSYACRSSGGRRAAAATNCVARSKVGDWDNLFNAAIAKTKHAADSRSSVFSDFGRCLRNRGELAELYVDAVDGGCH